MFVPAIVTGERYVEQRLGRVADYCTLCRGVRAFALARAAVTEHFCGLPWGRGTTVGHVAFCEDCGHGREVEPLSYAAIASARSRDALAELVRLTFPDVHEVHRERLELERLVAESSDALDAGVRRGWIDEILAAANVASERHASSFDRPFEPFRALLLAVAWLGGVALVASVAASFERQGYEFSATAALASAAVLAAGAGGLALHANAARRRWTRRELVPTLARALRNLRPTEDELAAALEPLRATRTHVARRLEPGPLSEAAQRIGPWVSE